MRNVYEYVVVDSNYYPRMFSTNKKIAVKFAKANNYYRVQKFKRVSPTKKIYVEDVWHRG